jgi:prepilin-type N-terminal cleavage/methylation domain-containing protein
MRSGLSRTAGFSLVECLVVIALVTSLMAVAVVNVSGSMQTAKAESAVSAIMSQLRLARTMAIVQRRNVTVTIDTNFDGPGNLQHVDIQVVTLPGEQPQPVLSAPLPGGTKFVLEPGVPDTPLLLGACAAVCFNNVSGGSAVMQFQPTGQFLDGNNNVLNGTVFVGVPGAANTARAVTVMGGVGSVQRYSWTGTEWER